MSSQSPPTDHRSLPTGHSPPSPSGRHCAARTVAGDPCRAYAVAGSDYCFHHEPALAAARRRARSKGGRARHGRRVGSVAAREAAAAGITLEDATDAVALLETTIRDTLGLENSLSRARTLGYLTNLFLRAIDITVLEERVARLERILRSHRG
jgi:hypothetical protein